MRAFDDWLARDYPTARLVPFCSCQQFVEAAMKAYYAACRELVPPPGQAWIERVDGRFLAWAGPQDFHAGLFRELDARVRVLAIQRGDLVRTVYTDEQVAAMDAEDAELPVRGDCPLPVDARGAGAEPLRSAAMDGRASAPGACPPGSAVGPATEVSHAADITTPATPLFCVSGMQKLPEVNHRVNLDREGEKIS